MQPFGHGIGVGPHQQHGELVATRTGGNVAGAEVGAQSFADARENLIARDVAAQVIDAGEAIEIECDERAFLIAYAPVGQRRQQVPPVADTGERIGVSQLAQVCFIVAQPSEVATCIGEGERLPHHQRESGQHTEHGAHHVGAAAGKQTDDCRDERHADDRNRQAPSDRHLLGGRTGEGAPGGADAANGGQTGDGERTSDDHRRGRMPGDRDRGDASVAGGNRDDTGHQDRDLATRTRGVSHLDHGEADRGGQTDDRDRRRDPGRAAVDGDAIAASGHQRGDGPAAQQQRGRDLESVDRAAEAGGGRTGRARKPFDGGQQQARAQHDRRRRDHGPGDDFAVTRRCGEYGRGRGQPAQRTDEHASHQQPGGHGPRPASSRDHDGCCGGPHHQRDDRPVRIEGHGLTVPECDGISIPLAAESIDKDDCRHVAGGIAPKVGFPT